MFLGFPSGIIVVPRDLLKEFFAAPSEYLSLSEGLEDIDFRHVFHTNILHNPYHKRVIKNQLTENIPKFLPEMMDELRAIFNDDLEIINESTNRCYLFKGVDWTSIAVHETARKIVVRINQRVFVGLPLCTLQEITLMTGRNSEYLQSVIGHSLIAGKAGMVLSFVPKFLGA